MTTQTKTHPIIERTIKNIERFYVYAPYAIAIDCTVPSLDLDKLLTPLLPIFPSGTTLSQLEVIIERDWYEICELAFAIFHTDDNVHRRHSSHARFVQDGRSGKHLCLSTFAGKPIDEAFYSSINDYAEYGADEPHTDTIEFLVDLCEYLEALYEHFQPNRGAVVAQYMHRAILSHLYDCLEHQQTVARGRFLSYIEDYLTPSET